MHVFGETKANEETEIFEDILGKEIYHKNEKEREILETLL